MSNMMIPTVVEGTGKEERHFDIFSKLLVTDRIVFVGGGSGDYGIDDDEANVIVAQLLYLASEDPRKDVKMYINSPGGSITAGAAILDTMNSIAPDIATFGVGQAASMAAIILANGTKGKRYVMPNARIMIHQPSMFGLHGQATDIDLAAKEILNMREQMNQILAEQTGHTIEKIAADVERNFTMRAQQAVEYGIVDKIFRKKSRNTIERTND